MTEFARSSIENEGIAPSEVAQQVLDAIHRDQFWILTDPAMGAAATERVGAGGPAGQPDALSRAGATRPGGVGYLAESVSSWEATSSLSVPRRRTRRGCHEPARRCSRR